MEDRVINAIALGALGGLVIAAIAVAIHWAIKGTKNLVDKVESRIPEIRERVFDSVSATSKHAQSFGKAANERIQSARKAFQDSSTVRTDRYDQLERLGKLRDSGVLTEEEFQTEKSRILNE